MKKWLCMLVCCLSVYVQAQVWTLKEKEPAAPGTWWCFRNTVTLDEQPRSLELRLAADTKYWLWVNDELQVSEGGLKRGLGDAPIRWLVDDCVKFVEREIRRGNHYDAIIMDPPSYGRGPKGEIWKIEESVYPLVQLCAKLLTDKPLFFLINSYTTGLQPAVLTYMISTALKKFDGKVTASEIGLPVSSNGLVLPCGASGRFESIC
jgi:hypothetical protein